MCPLSAVFCCCYDTVVYLNLVKQSNIVGSICVVGESLKRVPPLDKLVLYLCRLAQLELVEVQIHVKLVLLNALQDTVKQQKMHVRTSQ